MKKLLLVLLMLISPMLKSQDLNINQTLEYINKKVNDYKASIDQNVTYVWEIDKVGRLTITQYVNNEFNFSQSVYLKALDKNKIFINDENLDQDDYFYTIHIKCKNNNRDVLKKYRRMIPSSSIFIRLFPDERSVNQLKNAITYLIILAESKSEFIEREVDPFDKKVTVIIPDTKTIKKKNKKK